MIRLFAVLALFFTVLLLPTKAYADCSGTGCFCSVSATAANFGVYDTITQAAVDSTGSVEVSCGSDQIGDAISYEVELSKGVSGRITARKLTSGHNALMYNLYTNASRTTIWGDGKGGSSVTVTDGYTMTVLCCEDRTYTAYGRIDAGQNVGPGLYTDSIIITVSW